MMRKEGFTPQSIRKLYEDKASETAAILKERLSLREIGYLRAQLLEGTLPPTQQQAYV